MSAWKIVVPHAASNYVLNPSAETTGNYATYLGSTVTRSTTYSARGEYSYKIVPGGAGRGVTLNTSTDLDGISVYVLFYARDVVNGSLVIDSGGSTYATTRMQIMGNDWYLYISEVANDISVDFAIYNTANETWYLDAVMVTLAVAGDNPAQTYLDGDQPGCVWSLGAHTSMSTRPVTSRAGGIVYDLLDDYGLHIESIAGDMTRPLNIISERPFRAGGSVDMTRIGARTLILVGWLITSNVLPLHAQHVALTDILRPDAVPVASDGRPQPVVLQYWGTEKVLQLRAHYGGGLDEMQDAKDCGNQRYPLTFDVVEPYWEEVIERALDVTTETDVTANFVLGRVDGEWSELGPPTPAPNPITNFVTAMAEDKTYFYVGGLFTNYGGAGFDHLIRYNKATGVWSTPWTTAPDDGVRDLLVMPDGKLVAVGRFNAIDAVPADYAAIYDPVTDTWSELGGGLASDTERIVLDEAGVLWVVDGMQLKNLVPGGAWANVGAAFTNPIDNRAIGITPFNNDGQQTVAYVYVGGSNVLPMTGTIMYLARLQVYGPAADAGTATWEQVGVVGAGVNYMSFMNRNTLYISVGLFNGRPMRIVNNAASLGGSTDTGPYITDTTYPPIDGTSYIVVADPSTGWVYTCGTFTDATGVFTGADLIGLRYRDGVWYKLPVTPPAAPVGDQIESRIMLVGRNVGSSSDLVNQGNLYFGFNTKGTAQIPGGISVLTASVPGGAESKPLIQIGRSGGVSAVIESVYNRTTGAEILLNVEIMDGETITVDLVNLRVTTDYQGSGSAARIITPLPGSRFASFSLLPTGNQIDVRVVNDGATIDGVLRYTQRHHSYRSANVAE